MVGSGHCMQLVKGIDKVLHPWNTYVGGDVADSVGNNTWLGESARAVLDSQGSWPVELLAFAKVEDSYSLLTQ